MDRPTYYRGRHRAVGLSTMQRGAQRTLDQLEHWLVAVLDRGDSTAVADPLEVAT